MHSHNRSLTHSDIVTQGKRLSLQFPIQPAAGSASSPRMSPRSRPQSWVSTPLSPEMIPSPTESNFLAVIAAQERRVLELKEELVKAEEDLKMLKKHWVSQEAVRKRNDMRKVTQLQPLNTPLANLPHNDDDGDGSALWMQREMERRKALLASTKTSQRKVFSGSRHMRTLSLLSPDKAQAPSFPQPSDTRDLKDDEPRRSSLSRASTSSSGFSSPIPNKTNDDRYDLGGLPSIQRDAIIRTGKQLATDFKDGLFTFIEDIRQATVGDEALQGADANSFQNGPKLQPASSDRRPTLDRAAGSSKQGANDQSDDIGSSFWKEHGLSEPQPAAAKKIAKSARNTTPPKTPQKSTPQLAQKVVDDFDEEWDNWDTPAPPAHSTSTDGSDYSDDAGDTATTVSGRSSARTSTSDRTSQDSKRNSIPWPDLIKLSPTNLKRTASHLMKEWEKNLTPPPESRQFNLASADYIGRAEDSLN
ncbi:hypothetical protein GQ43DRAFT_366003 [Delitschia confertaspora ATCC 74209]|uniref:DUF4048 domain-containing protein n=1 Tax=Delitschia confertaspora ATCC 74209 TaxID=1513339 RepID=A0A9P4JSV8_9PLEO|nr:hypothetical protein GQ43DRAFT_366003 [Delitschia confertaspora ATCC 74209]